MPVEMSLFLVDTLTSKEYYRHLVAKGIVAMKGHLSKKGFGGRQMSCNQGKTTHHFLSLDNFFDNFLKLLKVQLNWN